MTIRTSNSPRRQRGAALLIMMLLVLVAATATLVTRINLNNARALQLADSRDALSIARDALMDHAAVYPDFVSGAAARLPCPDLDGSGGFGEGAAHTTACGVAGETMMGRLPWRTLGIAPPKDSGGACLWYVVSGGHKDAAGATASMINPDSNGQLQLYAIESGVVIEGTSPDDRPVAMIIAPMQGIDGQSRAAPGAAGRQCSSSFTAADFLDVDTISGISNRAVSGVADAIDVFAAASGHAGSHNDRFAVVTRADLAKKVAGRHDFDSSMRSLGRAVAACVADYARNNPAGANDRRMPWPAPLSLPDYRIDAGYDDAIAGLLAGRLPDRVDDSNGTTGNGIGRILADCDSGSVLEWTPQKLSMWQNWKDHFFYAVAESYAPTAPVPSTCTSCLTVNGSGQYAAIVLYSDARLPALGQVRNSPPIDADTKDDAGNYLEGSNAGFMPFSAGVADFTSQPSSSTFNDMLFCIDGSLNVSEC